MAEFGLVCVFKFDPTSLVRLDAILAEDGNVADRRATPSLSEYFSGAYLCGPTVIRPDWLRLILTSPLTPTIKKENNSLSCIAKTIIQVPCCLDFGGLWALSAIPALMLVLLLVLRDFLI